MDRRSDYHYELPSRQIAQVPAERRDESRLLVAGPLAGGGLCDRRFADIVELIPPDAVLVVNDTRVFPARLRTLKATGGAVELLFIERIPEPGEAGAAGGVGAPRAAAAQPGPGERWRCMARSSKSLQPGMILLLAAGQGETVTLAGGRQADSTVVVEVHGHGGALALLERYGEVPLPPYITRPTGSGSTSTGPDRERYQTVYAREPGAVAAPTAGLHFTQAVLDALAARGVTLARITLHVGLGTFAPMRAERIDEHRMHHERYHIAAGTAQVINAAAAAGRPVVAVGTTCVRALESAALRAHAAGLGERVAAGAAATDLFIRPGYVFRAVDHLITNFHLPESTLLMLVCAFAGYDPVMAAYRHAVASDYRFFSYGDAMLVSRSARS